MTRFPATTFLIVTLLLVFIGELAAGAPGNDARLLAMGAMPDSGAMGGEYWRLLSYAWLHAGYLHLALNLGLLGWVGRIVERRAGSLALLGVYLGSALAGGLFILWNASLHPRSGVSLGASAAVSGLLTCGLVLLYRPRAAGFGQPTWVRLTLWSIIAGGLAISFLPGVSLVGHVGGLVLGVILGCLVPVKADAPRQSA